MVAEARWNMLGHVLCMDRNAPEQRALQYAVEGAQMYTTADVDVTLPTSYIDMKHREINEPS